MKTPDKSWLVKSQNLFSQAALLIVSAVSMNQKPVVADPSLVRSSFADPSAMSVEKTLTMSTTA
ncbi:MAG TPA: hypothetical protein PLK30_08260 [Blastocatellia bacterium]|nr:hypothetical protein [Blastocatellia bacterium]